MSWKIVAISTSLINRAGITAHNTATHMQLIGYNMFDAIRLRALQLSSRQCYIVRTGPFYVAFWSHTTLPIKFQCFVKFCYAVIAYIAFHAYLTTHFLLFYAKFLRFISTGWCSKSIQMKKVNKQCLLDTPRTVRVSEKDEYNTKLFTPEISIYQSLYRKNSRSHRCHFIKNYFFPN